MLGNLFWSRERRCLPILDGGQRFALNVFLDRVQFGLRGLTALDKMPRQPLNRVLLPPVVLFVAAAVRPITVAHPVAEVAVGLAHQETGAAARPCPRYH